MVREAIPIEIEAEILERLQGLIAETPTRPPGEFTTIEFAKANDCGVDAARKRLRSLMQTGKVQPAKVVYKNAWGESTMIKGWRLVGE